MQKYQLIARTSLRGPEGTAIIDEEREQRGPVGFLLEAVEDGDQQLEGVLGHLGETNRTGTLCLPNRIVRSKREARP
jgi:hypothetical protein